MSLPPTRCRGPRSGTGRGKKAYAIRGAVFAGCSTASNHSLDPGPAGIRSTLEWLDRVGVRHTGTARSAAERWRTTHYRIGHVKVAHLSFTASFNGLVPSATWQANRIDARRIVEDARRARRRGADIVVLSLHWGEEHRNRPTADQRDLARRLLATRAIDLIVGHHAHVVTFVHGPRAWHSAARLTNA